MEKHEAQILDVILEKSITHISCISLLIIQYIFLNDIALYYMTLKYI